MNNFLELVKKRTSCRQYLEKDVPEEKINYCLSAAKHAPSACNKQPWRFIVVKDKELRDLICKKALLPGLPMPWLQQVPVIVVVCAKTSFITHSFASILSGIKYHLIDIGIAGEHFVLAAETQNLGTCWIGWFKEKQVKKILSIPKNIKVLSLISLGYSADNTTSPKKKNIEEFTYRDTWK
jgi:nitroreductase